MKTYTLIIAMIAIVVSCASTGATRPGVPSSLDAPGILNFSEIRGDTGFAGPVVGFGGATSREAMAWLRDRGYATVINLRGVDEVGVDLEGCRRAAENAGLVYLYIPFDPSKASGLSAVQDVTAAIKSNQNQPVYIHCRSATRVAAIWMIGRILIDGWQLETASEECNLIAKKPEEAIAFATKYVSMANGEGLLK